VRLLDHIPHGASSRPGERLVGADLSKLSKIRPKDIVVRFVFGAAISLVAGLISLGFGARAGGMFLAFPAILPASLTLVEKKEGTEAAIHDLDGTILGAAALGAFALVAGVGLRAGSAALALPAALATWLGASLVAYVVVESLRRRFSTTP
jgi:uncharacterized membrane protein YfcA